jgi:hypothetical protein
LHPFSVLMELMSEAIACDSSMRFSEWTFIRMMTRIIKNTTCKWPANNRKKAEVWNHLLITGD